MFFHVRAILKYFMLSFLFKLETLMSGEVIHAVGWFVFCDICVKLGTNSLPLNQFKIHHNGFPPVLRHLRLPHVLVLSNLHGACSSELSKQYRGRKGAVSSLLTTHALVSNPRFFKC